MTEANKRYIEFCKPFIDALKDLYSTMMDTELKASAPKIKTENILYGDITALIGISGVYKNGENEKTFKGNLVISWPTETYLKTASAMMMDEFTEINEEIADVGMEIANITTGNAKKVLNPQGFYIEMATPTTVNGKDYQLRTVGTAVTVLVPFSSALGEFFVELNYEDF